VQNKKYDVLVIGGGIAGYYSSKYLAKNGKAVALIEKKNLGGTALRWGALPVKKALDWFKKDRKKDLNFSWDKDLKILENKIDVALKDEKVDIYYGEGEFIDSKSYKVKDILLEGEYIIIATGTEPISVPEIPIDRDKIITHREAIDFKFIPENTIVLGGNVEGVEFAAIYAEMGVNITLIEKEDMLLPGNDEDLVFPIEKHLLDKGVKIIKGVGAKKAWVEEEKVKVLLESHEIIEGDKVLVTFLREPNIPKGIEKLNIVVEEGRILVDENLRTGEKNIFAIGDINGIMGMAHVAINQAIQVADYILYKSPVVMNYDELPRAVFTLPEMAGVGKQEGQLKDMPYKVGYCDFKDTWRGWAKDVQDGFVKVIMDVEGKILGIWMVGEDVSEYVGLLSILLDNEFTIEDIKSNLIIHPTLTESILEAVLNTMKN
jgi:dihydrolipoamide dehydrogenase